MTIRAQKVPKIETEKKSLFDVGAEDWAPSHGPNSTVKTTYCSAAAPATARDRRGAEKSTLNCHFDFRRALSKWLSSSQFYWDLTKNKFSFLPSSLASRSQWQIQFYTRSATLNLEKLGQSLHEEWPNPATSSKRNWRAANPCTWENLPYHLSLTKWYSARSRNYLDNFQQKLKVSQFDVWNC